MLILNAFSLQMIIPGQTIKTREISINEIPQGLTSCIGHTDTATVLTNLLGQTIATNRVNVTLATGQKAIVAQFIGGRLPEGCTKLPEGCTIKFIEIEIV